MIQHNSLSLFVFLCFMFWDQDLFVVVIEVVRIRLN